MGTVGTQAGPADDPALATRSVTPGPLPPPPHEAARPLGRLDAARCSVQALARGDSVVATAAPATRWVLIEQPGPWGREALAESRFDQEVAPRLAARARAENVRLLLVRRPGERLAESGRRWAYADSRLGRRPPDRTVGRLGRRTVVPAHLPGVHPRRARRLLRATRSPAGPCAPGAGPRRRLGVQPPRR